MKNVIVYMGDSNTWKKNIGLLSLKNQFVFYEYQMSALVFSNLLEEDRDLLYINGADRIIEIEESHSAYGMDSIRAKIIIELLQEEKSDYLFLGSSQSEREMGAMICGGTGWEGWNQILSVGVKEKKLFLTRLTYGNNLIGRVQFRSHTVLSFVQTPEIVPKVEKKKGSYQKISDIDKAAYGKADLMKEYEEEDKAESLTQAKVVVGGGYGLGSKENFQLLQRFASSIHGVVGATRPVIEEGWISKNYQIGQSGKRIAPDLYIAFGISGAIQHVSGIIDAKYIIAVNADSEAAIFQYADRGIVGDISKILPALVQEFTN